MDGNDAVVGEVDERVALDMYSLLAAHDHAP
jgi:hypothetical protein